MTRLAAAVVVTTLVAALAAACTSEESPEPVDDVASTTEAADDAAPTTTFDPHTPAPGPEDLARRVTAAEDAIRDPHTPELDAAAAGFELQVLYRQLGRRPGWRDAVLDAVPRRYRATVRSHVRAREELRAMHNQLSDTLPAWRIVDPAPAADLLSYYEEGEATYGVPWHVLAAVNLVETAMGRIRGTSTAGAQGPMQFIPGTWDAFGEGDINDPRDAILAAARYLAHNGGGDGRIDNALFRYNNSTRYVAAVKAWSSVMAEDPRAFRGFYHWRVLYLSTEGDVWLPVDYERTEPIKVRRYLRDNPDHRMSTSTR